MTRWNGDGRDVLAIALIGAAMVVGLVLLMGLIGIPAAP